MTRVTIVALVVVGCAVPVRAAPTGVHAGPAALYQAWDGETEGEIFVMDSRTSAPFACVFVFARQGIDSGCGGAKIIVDPLLNSASASGVIPSTAELWSHETTDSQISFSISWTGTGAYVLPGAAAGIGSRPWIFTGVARDASAALEQFDSAAFGSVLPGPADEAFLDDAAYIAY